jgi:hypothetical protein
MSNKLNITTNILTDHIEAYFDGVIDEDANFEKIKSLGLKKYIFDFEKIKLINSCGIREWIKYIDELKNVEIIYRNCPQIIIEQINMVHGFIKKGTIVDSFIAPYFCEQCDDEKKVLLKSTEVVNFQAPTKTCMKCGGELEFDAIPKQYFAFVQQGK